MDVATGGAQGGLLGSIAAFVRFVCRFWMVIAG